MSRVFFLCLLLPVVLGDKPTGDSLMNKPKDDIHLKVIKLKDIPSSELKQHILFDSDDKNKFLISEGKLNLPAISHIKPIKQGISSKPKGIKKNKSKLKKLKLKRKQLKRLIKKNNVRQKQLKKLKQKNKKKVQKRNKWKYKGKRQMRNLPSNNKLTEIIDRIVSYHKEGQRSKLSTQDIRKQILNLLTAHKRVIKPGKDCKKQSIGKKKGRNVFKKRFRSLNRNKLPRKRPMKVVIFKDVRGKGSKMPVNKKDRRTKMYETKGKKGKVKSKITVRLGKKNKKKGNKKTLSRKIKQKKGKNV